MSIVRLHGLAQMQAFPTSHNLNVHRHPFTCLGHKCKQRVTCAIVDIDEPVAVT